MITAGAQQAIDLVIRALVPRRDAIVVESPAYAGTLDSLRLARARVVALDVADAPWDLDALDARLAQTGGRLALLTPDFQNPTGHLMPDAQRERLAAIARRRAATLIVDETLCELDLDGGEAPRPLARHANGDVAVITIGSLSKCAWAGLRVGWVRARPQLLTRLAHLRSAADLSGAPVEQLAAVGLIAELDTILAERRPLLREQMGVVLDAVRGLGWSAAAPAGGLSVWARLPRGSATALAEAAASRGLRLAPGQRLSPDGALDSYVRLPFTLPAGELRSAMERLADAWDDVGATRRPRDQRRGHDGRQHPGRRTAPVHDE